LRRCRIGRDGGATPAAACWRGALPNLLVNRDDARRHQGRAGDDWLALRQTR
jgi:hypothetical protein